MLEILRGLFGRSIVAAHARQAFRVVVADEHICAPSDADRSHARACGFVCPECHEARRPGYDGVKEAA